MAYLVPLKHFCDYRAPNRELCPLTPKFRLVDTWGGFRGNYCSQHAGAELAKVDAEEKAIRKGGGPRPRTGSR